MALSLSSETIHEIMWTYYPGDVVPIYYTTPRPNLRLSLFGMGISDNRLALALMENPVLGRVISPT